MLNKIFELILIYYYVNIYYYIYYVYSIITRIFLLSIDFVNRFW